MSYQEKSVKNFLKQFKDKLLTFLTNFEFVWWETLDLVPGVYKTPHGKIRIVQSATVKGLPVLCEGHLCQQK